MGKVLIVTYYWPPGAGAGVQRWLKFARYLPEFGWTPVILTIDPHYAAYPATDSALENEIPASLKVLKTPATDWFRLYKKDKSGIPSAGFATGGTGGVKSKISRFIRGNFFIPDPRRGWNNWAFGKACELIEKEGISHVITTSPPHSTQLIGLKLKKRYSQLKWTADLRDPWTDIYYYNNFYPSPLARYIDSRYEKAVLSGADNIITVGESLKSIFSSKASGIANKIGVITNGYDEDDFVNIAARAPARFTISYIGTISDHYPAGGFLAAVEKFAAAGRDVLVRFVGAAAGRQKQLINSALKSCACEFIPYMDHSSAVRYMFESSVLLMIIPEHAGNKCIITGKLFEYMASRRPVLCLGPADGDAASILTGTSSGKCFSYNDSDGILAFLEENFINPRIPVSDISSYSRKNLAGKLSGFLNT
jgi:glycosyltransferase involved in cell wall biosynthesis